MADFGELVEHYTNTAVIQIQRIEVSKKQSVKHLCNVTIAPLIRSENSRRADFTSKQTMQVDESDMANLAIGIMGLKPKIAIQGTTIGDSSKVLYVNVNQDQTTNIVISTLTNCSGTNAKLSQSICFKNSERYPFLRLVVTQLTKNSTQYEQTVADTLNLLKASVLR